LQRQQFEKSLLDPAGDRAASSEVPRAHA
jgi:hypothetical protein